MTTVYDKAFYEGQADESLRSARAVVPVFLGLMPVRSVVDFGCGVGSWLRAFVENGVDDVLGCDGDYVDRSALVIPKDRFRPTDLSASSDLGRRFDLAVSLEVAEHLPEHSARGFVQSITRAAPVVLFSAAIPGQTGVGHINCRWPRYWAKHFREFGYDRFDPIRPLIVDDPRVESWYRSNIFVYVDRRFTAPESIRRPRRMPRVRLSKLHMVLVDFVPIRSALRAWGASLAGRTSA